MNNIFVWFFWFLFWALTFGGRISLFIRSTINIDPTHTLHTWQKKVYFWDDQIQSNDHEKGNPSSELCSGIVKKKALFSAEKTISLFRESEREEEIEQQQKKQKPNFCRRSNFYRSDNVGGKCEREALSSILIENEILY